MRTIWKYTPPTKVGERFGIRMPAGAKPLTVQWQEDKPVFWCLLDDESHTTERVFIWFATGGEIAVSELAYIGTVQNPLSGMVYHLFEIL